MKEQHAKGAVTIRQVAQSAGVSPMTVSRVLNSKDTVRPATRDKVMRVIEELNYRPNLSARRLAGGKSLFIGLVYHNPSASYMAQVLIGAVNACRDLGHHIVLEDLGTHLPYEEPQKAADHLARVGLDAMVAIPPLSGFAVFVDAVERYGIPVVRMAPEVNDRYALQVAIDDRLAAAEMTQHLIDLGHRRIAMIQGPDLHPASTHRYDGFRDRMAANGLSVDDALVAPGEFSYRSGLDAARRLLALPEPPTAIFASNDDMAAGAIAAANMHGLSVPGDVSIAGFDDTEIATNIWPELTTVRQPISEMARVAVELLGRLSERGLDKDGAKTGEPTNPLLSHTIVHRDSVGAPPARAARVQRVQRPVVKAD